MLAKMLNENYKKKFLFIIFSKDFYKFHYSITTAITLRALEKDVSVFVTGYACNYIKKNWQEYDIDKIYKKISQKKMPSLEQLYKDCADLNLKFYYCETAIDFLDINELDITNLIKILPVGMYSIMSKHKNDDILFI